MYKYVFQNLHSQFCNGSNNGLWLYFTVITGRRRSNCVMRMHGAALLDPDFKHNKKDSCLVRKCNYFAKSNYIIICQICRAQAHTPSSSTSTPTSYLQFKIKHEIIVRLPLQTASKWRANFLIIIYISVENKHKMDFNFQVVNTTSTQTTMYLNIV